MAARVSKRRSEFDDDQDARSKRRRSIDEEDRTRTNGSSGRWQHRDGDRRDNKGGHTYRDPFGGDGREGRERHEAKEDSTRHSRRHSPPRSPRRDRRRDQRSRSPDRHDHGGRNGTRHRSPPRGPRSARSPPRRRPEDGAGRRDGHKGADNTRASTSTSKQTDTERQNPAASRMDVDAAEDEEEVQMRRMMGFAKFRSTKNTKVPGNDKNYGVRKEKKTEYRQYMNRAGGFNRPLSPG